MTNDDYTKITWPEVREGDVLMHKDGDRLTVQGFEGLQIRTIAGLYAPSEYRVTGLTPYRRKPEMPTVPGAYADKRGVHWLLNTDGGWWGSGFGWRAAEDAAEFAPFTRLVPMPTEEQVKSVAPIFKREWNIADDQQDHGNRVNRGLIAAVMALQNVVE